MARERDVRNAIQNALVQTGGFTSVVLTGLPEDHGLGASQLTAASIQPSSTRTHEGWDSTNAGGRDFQCQVVVTVLARHEDAQLCDELAEQLANIVRDAVDGQSLVPGFNQPARTMITGWVWLPRTAPERRIALTVTYHYLQDGWTDADTSL